jgi:hypothetical protein
MSTIQGKESVWVTWFIISLLVLFILSKGFYALFVIGDPDHPGWDYQPIKDIPGESAYAIYETLSPQHIMGKKGE